jgi:hypothetical protein
VEARRGHDAAVDDPCALAVAVPVRGRDDLLGEPPCLLEERGERLAVGMGELGMLLSVESGTTWSSVNRMSSSGAR